MTLSQSKLIVAEGLREAFRSYGFGIGTVACKSDACNSIPCSKGSNNDPYPLCRVSEGCRV